MRALFAAVMIALLASEPAFAQPKTPGPPPPPPKSRQEIEAERAAEKAYQNSLRSIPDQGPTDPWGTVRPPKADKGSAAKPKAKTGNAGN
jgi:hypothetical protein